MKSFVLQGHVHIFIISRIKVAIWQSRAIIIGMGHWVCQVRTCVFALAGQALHVCHALWPSGMLSGFMVHSYPHLVT